MMEIASWRDKTWSARDEKNIKDFGRQQMIRFSRCLSLIIERKDGKQQI